MILFLTVFILLYGSLHGYGYLKAKAALGFGLNLGIPLAIFMLVMVSAPIIVHYVENAGLKNTARAVAYFSYTWMALIFLFFCAGALIDIYHWILRLGSMISGSDVAQFYPSNRFQFFAPLIVSSLAVLYGFFEAANIRTERLVINTPGVPAQVGRLKIVQISDVHLGILIGERKLKKILDMAASHDPDILVSTGDLVDGEIDQNGELVKILRSINPKYGKYAVTGNHEYYAGVDRAVKWMEAGGFKVLRGQSFDLDGMIRIAGVDDPTGRSMHREAEKSEKTLLSQVAQENNGRNPREFVLLLKHRPEVERSSVGLFDLQLSGHTHKGQIFPFCGLTRLFYPNDGGFSQPGKGSHLYVSRGSGTWGPPIRFLAPPEITIIELVHAEEKPAVGATQVASVSQ